MGLLDFKLNSSPRPELFSSPYSSLAQSESVLECPTLECPWSAHPQSLPWSAQPQSLPGVTNARVPLCPNSIPASPWPQPQSQNLSGVPNPRSAQPQSAPGGQPRSLPGVPNLRDFLECPQRYSPCVPNPRVSLPPREGGDIRSKVV